MKVYDGRFDKKALPTKHTIAVVSANRIICGENDQMTIRRNGREDWSLFYCEAGKLYFEDSVLEAGQVWVYAPNVPQKYTMYSKDKTIYHYLHFTGSDVTELLSSLGISLSYPIEVKSSSISDVLDSIQNSILEDSSLSKLSAEYHTLHLLSMLVRRRAHFSEVHMMKRVTDDMEHSFAAPYDAYRYADMFRISVSRFNHLFKQCVGVSPYAYYVRLRMANAISLLEDTHLRIQDIAEKCGYADAVYFTQVFKKNIGLSPSNYRKLNKTLK